VNHLKQSHSINAARILQMLQNIIIITVMKNLS